MHRIDPAYRPLEPHKSARTRALRRALQYWVARAVFAVAALLPIRANQRLGRWAGRLGYRLQRLERGVCEFQMELALPEIPPAGRTRLIRRCFEHMGMTLFEVLAMPRLRREGARWVTFRGEDALRAAHAQGRGVIVITGHCGNWELFAVAAELLRIPMTAIARPLHNARLNDLLLRQRRSEFLEVAERGTASSARRLLQALKQGRALIVAIDQDIDAQSVYADFFGRPARTPRVAASLALKLDVPVVTGFDERLADGTHCIHFEALPIPQAVRGAADPEQALTQAFNDRITAHIRRVPEQWGWNHRRWLHRPAPEGGPPEAP